MSATLLQVSRLSIRSDIRQRQPVTEVSFSVQRGEAFTLVGETGSGKTLVAQAVCGNLSDELTADGEITFRGSDLIRLSRRERRRLYGRELFLLPQEPDSALDPVMRVKNQVAEVFRHVRGCAARDLDSMLAPLFSGLELSLSNTGKLYPYQLSGGMKQRILLAIGLAVPAGFIVVDEPTKGLDEVAKKSAVRRLSNLLDRGKTLLCITHDLKVARELGGHMAVMYGGCIVESGSVNQVLNSPRHPYTRGLIGAAPENGMIPIDEEILAAMKQPEKND